MDDLKTYLKKICIFTSATIILSSASNSYAREITLINKCNFPVWFGFSVGGPKPANNNYLLNANGGTNKVTIPTSTWSGVVAGRTQCNQTSCVTADCGGGTGACTRGFEQPATQAEFTLSPTGTDFYDVTVINGINLPISVTPNIISQASNPYFCGSPGAVTPSAGLGACSWNLSPPLNELQWVQRGGAACSTNANCAQGTVCGISINPGQDPLLKKTCGQLLGYWTPNQICGVQRNYGAPFYCSQKLPAPQDTLTWWHLMACVNVPSCYHPGAPSTCCGCVNWDKIGIPVPPSPLTQQCQNSNPNWVNTVLPGLAWLKKACPTVYTYPYDDMSSTFTCRSIVNNANVVNYTITFCPTESTPTPPKKCIAPTNVQTSFTADKKSITLSWAKPVDSDTIINYQVNNWLNTPMWKGTQTTFTDNSLPGTNGTFVYYLYSNCSIGPSAGTKVEVKISDNMPCLPPTNIKASYSADKKSITMTWQQPNNSAPVLNYQINDWQNKFMWKGTSTTFKDTTLPGTSGTFVYYLYSNCGTGLSQPIQESVVIN